MVVNMTEDLSMRNQSGLSIWALLIVCSLIVFFALLAMKLTPLYVDNLKLRDGLKDLSERATFHTMTRKEMVNKLYESLYVDSAHKIVDIKREFHVEKTKTDITISVDYERVEHLAFNISALLDFENSVTTPLP